MKVLSAQQIRDWDKYTITNEPIRSIDLMERAANQLFKAFTWNCNPKAVVVFCGMGNNGGDGLAVARLYKESGTSVRVFLVDSGSKISPDCAENLKRAELAGVEVVLLKELSQLNRLAPGTLVIDALLGSGTNRPATGFLAAVIQWLNTQSVTIYSIDLPSGLQGDNFHQPVPESVVKASKTFSFQLIKKSFLHAENQLFTGAIELLDIGLDFSFYGQAVSNIHFLADTISLPKLGARPVYSEKRSFGNAFLLAGSQGMMGAAVLATKACLKSGAGLTNCYVPHGGLGILQTSIPEAIVWCDPEEHFLTRIPEKLDQSTAVAIGPGLGKNKKTAELLEACLKQIKVPLILDADALNLIAANNFHSLLPKNSLLTPHEREFERLFGSTDNADKALDLQLEASEKFGIYILRKGAYSKLSSPDGTLIVNSTGNPGQAKGGNGDVLTGCILGLAARTGNIETAAVLGMYLHGLAADLALSDSHEESLLPSDCINMLPKAFAHLSKT